MSVSLPSRGSFHLSLTVLSAIGHQVVFSLRGWAPYIPTGLHVSRGTLRIPSLFIFAYARLTLFARPSHVFLLMNTDCWILGCSSFARRYLRNRCCFLFLRVLRCFSSPGSLRMAMDSPYGDRASPCRVSPFGHPRLNGYVLLNVAFRSLSRPSSAPGTKASTLCSLFLDPVFSLVRLNLDD